MVYLAHSYQFLIVLIQELESGIPVSVIVKTYIDKNHNEFARELAGWYSRRQFVHQMSDHHDSPGPTIQIKNPHRRALFEVLTLAMEGGSVLLHLYDLEKEFKFVCEQNLETHLAQLPFKLMIPLLLFQFPAFLLLILGPILSQLVAEVQ